MRKRVSSSGQSNDLPLKVTSTGRSVIRSRKANNSDRSSQYSRKKNCSISRPPLSHHATPMRNAYVPLPPARPVVSVSRKSHCSGSKILSGPSGESNRTALLSGKYRGGLAHQQRTERYSPNWFFFGIAPRVRINRSGSSQVAFVGNCDSPSSLSRSRREARCNAFSFGTRSRLTYRTLMRHLLPLSQRNRHRNTGAEESPAQPA